MLSQTWIILLLACSCWQNFWSYYQLIIVHQKGGSFFYFGCSPCSGCFITYMGVHFSIVELDNVIQIGNLSRMSGFLHCSKCARWFDCFLQYMSGLEYMQWDYYTPSAPFLEPLSKVAATFQEDVATFPYYSHGLMCNPSSTLFSTQGPLLNFPAKSINCQHA